LLAGRIAESPLTQLPPGPGARATLNPEHQDPEALDGIQRGVLPQFPIGINLISWRTRKSDHLKWSHKKYTQQNNTKTKTT
jgi:hypothetical protein